MIDFLIGFILGLVLVGTSTQRQIKCANGHISGALFHATIHNVAYFFSIYLIVEKNFWGFAGTSFGAILISGYVAYLNRRTHDRTTKSR